MYERGGVFRSDKVDAQVDLGLTSFNTIKGHFHDDSQIEIFPTSFH